VPFLVAIANGGVSTPPAAPPPPAPTPAPPPPAPTSALPPGVTLEDVNAAAAQAAAGAGALLAGGGSAEIAAAEAAAGASVSTQQAIIAANIPAAAGPQLAPAVDPNLGLPPGVTLADVDAAAAQAAAGAAALLAGGGSAEIAAAEAAAGASQAVIDAIIAADIPNVANIDVTGTGGAGGGVGGTDDLGAAGAAANANRPDLSNLPPWGLIDPFGERTLAASNPTLKGGGALSAIAQACSDYGVDAIAAIADAMHEGANGGIGDGGLAYGPFQDHLTEFADRPFYGKGRNNPVVNAWAWSANGIRYSVRAMVNGSPSAKGLRGHAAVYAIVYGYERPADKAGAYKTRAAEYDTLVGKGSGWAVYAAPFFKGPAAGGGIDTVPLAPPTSAEYKPAGVLTQWRSFVDVFRTTVPNKRHQVSSLASSLKEVFK
jgi:hypothetical protein